MRIGIIDDEPKEYKIKELTNQIKMLRKELTKLQQKNKKLKKENKKLTYKISHKN